MKIGLFSLIEYSFLDQRPQVMARHLLNWGHEVVYFQPFVSMEYTDYCNHDFQKYINECFGFKRNPDGVTSVTMANIPAHNVIQNLSQNFNQRFRADNARVILEQNFDLAIICDPAWGELLHELQIPFIYDHLDDTHLMHDTVTDVWDEAQKFSLHNSLANLVIQPNEAKRVGGIYIPNGFSGLGDCASDDIRLPEFNIGCLSAIADWFDYQSIDRFEGSALIIGPANERLLAPHLTKWQKESAFKFWVPRVERNVGLSLLSNCQALVVPFDDYHPVVDYVMPLKLIEYLAIGRPVISYFNKAIELEFGEFVTFYSKCGLLGLPDMNEAHQKAMSEPVNVEQQKSLAGRFNWDNVLSALRDFLSSMS